MKDFPRYSNLQILNHWLSAVLVFIVILLPFSRSLFNDVGSVFMVHKSLGVMIFVVTVMRIIIIKKQGVPEVLGDTHKMQRMLAKLVQGMLYLLLIIMPLSGYLMSNRSISFFNLFTIPGVSLPLELHADMHSLHIVAAFILIALICLHGLAALYHRVWVKDGVLQSMLFSKK